MKNIFLPIAFIAIVCSAIGCSQNVKLTGTVVFSDDGSPLPKGTVCLTTADFMARGDIGLDGSFTMGSTSQKDGIPPGTYQVHIINSEKVVGVSAEGMTLYEEVIDAKYTSATTSELSITVDGKTKGYDIKVGRFRQRK